MAEYGVMAQSVDLKPEAYSATGALLAKTITESMNQILIKASKGLQSFQGGGWDIMSHQITRIGDHLVVSFLLRR